MNENFTSGHATHAFFLLNAFFENKVRTVFDLFPLILKPAVAQDIKYLCYLGVKI
jgi:hypothetical protein